MTRTLAFFFFFTILYSCSDKEPDIAIELQPAPGSSIVVIGNTFAERMHYYNYLEPLIHRSFPDRSLTIRNLGWSADEISRRSRPLNFPSQDELLTAHKADYILACYGLNEAFKGTDSLDAFATQLTTYLQHLQQQKYNGKTQPQIILVSPIAHEKKGGLLPNPTEHNGHLALYTRRMKEVATKLNIPFVNLFSATQKLQKNKQEITINGIHLNEDGYKAVAQIMAKSLTLPVSDWLEDDLHLQNLKKIIDQKNQQFFYLYRAVNSEYIVGRRKEPWVQPAGGPVSYPSEFAKLQNMVLRLDSLVWKQSMENNPDHFVQSHRILNDTVQFTGLNKAGLQKPSASRFSLPEGFEINLFASEVNFSLTNPVTITFDPQGRMWVADMQSYPQYLPGAQPNDKILVLEDTDGDGVADKETVFADSLYMPTGMELGNGGVYVSQPPNLWFMKDTDGDGRADEKEIILHGFGTEDVHHTLDTHTWGPDGALYWHSGTFLHSQIETPWGPQRSDYGATWRFEPLTQKLEPYVSYPYANPWGHVFLRDGTQLISDVSTGMNYFAPPLSVAIEYPIKHTGMRDFLTASSKPKTCGTEIISSRHFPEELQGNVLLNTFVGTLGTKQHRLYKSGSGIVAQETEPLLQSSDPNFRPVDLQFGPDGALYIVDWYNPIINHGERALRDPLRDHTHGRIWRITYKNKDRLQPVDLTTLPIDQLLDQLKEYEDRLRYRTRTQLRQMDAARVLPALEQWLARLNETDALYDQHRLEALWVYQQFHQPHPSLLEALLKSSSDAVRTAATRVLFYWRNHVPDSEEKLIEMSRDSAMTVRLQSIISLSHFTTERSVNALLDAAMQETDYYIDYALKASFRHLKPVWWAKLKKDNRYLADQPAKLAWLLGSLADEKALQVPGFITDDPKWPQYGWQALTDKDYEELKDHPAVASFRKDWLAAAEAAKQDNRTPEEKARALIAGSDCFACHKEKEKLVGPAYAAIAKKYTEKDIPQLAKKVIEGGSGVWGDIPMTPHPGMEKADAEAMIKYILSIK